jgi:hypothetical protein
MELQAAIERISELLDDGELETSNTSMRRSRQHSGMPPRSRSGNSA